MSMDPFSTATEMLAALRAGTVTSMALTEQMIERIERYDGELNAIPIHTFEKARLMAAAADARRRAGDDAPLLGLPMTLKESTLTEGLPQSAGLPPFADYKPTMSGPITERVFGAGAVLLGKTNIPVALGDWQADSPVYGRTLNPWDRTRTPGGSTGGGGAALAAGLTPLEVGSDIGGSIRVPGTYCGVYGHRPSESAIPRSGAFPMADLPNPVAQMGVQGPLARCVDDLEMLFDLLAGAENEDTTAWRLELPPARATEAREFRVAVCPPLPGIGLSAAMKAALDRTAGALADAGARVEEVPLPLDFESSYLDYVRILQVMITMGQPEEEKHAAAAAYREKGDPVSMAMADGLTMSGGQYIMTAGARAAARVAWAGFFEKWDVLLAPMTPDVAFPHAEGPMSERILTIDGEDYPYFENIRYPSLAITPGLPSTAFPTGLSGEGLPTGLQAMGPHLEDRTPLAFARALEGLGFGFQAPPGF